MNTKSLLIALVGLSFAVLADTISLTLPENAVTVSMLKPEQQIFCHLDSEGGRKVLNNPELVHFLEHSVRSFPKGIELTWVFTGVRSQVRYEVTLADNEAFANARVIPVDNEQRLILYNLFNGKTYFWKVAALYQNGTRLETEPRNFTVDNQTPRFLYVPNVDNVRDIGGFVGLEGRIAPQGLIYRSSGLNKNSSDALRPGEDYSSYPLPRTLSLGFNINL